MFLDHDSFPMEIRFKVSECSECLKSISIKFIFQPFSLLTHETEAIVDVFPHNNSSISNRMNSYPKSPVSINGDNEVDDINEKHQSVDVTHRAVLWVDDVIEELPYG